jgi:hypothetical protein
MSNLSRAADLILEAATLVPDHLTELRDEIIDFAMSVKGSPIRTKIELIKHRKDLVASEVNAKADDNPKVAYVYWRCGILIDETLDGNLDNLAILSCVCSADQKEVDRLYGISYEEKKK